MTPDKVAASTIAQWSTRFGGVDSEESRRWLVSSFTTLLQRATNEQLLECRRKHGPPTLLVKRLHPEATLPKRAYSDDAGFDLYACERQHILPNEVVKVSTGIAIEIPTGYFGLVVTRSSMAHKGVYVTGGVIDSGYRGPVHVVLNTGAQSYEIKPGDRIAQMLVLPVFGGSVEEAAELSETSRGDKGFGSTGR